MTPRPSTFKTMGQLEALMWIWRDKRGKLDKYPAGHLYVEEARKVRQGWFSCRECLRFLPPSQHRRARTYRQDSRLPKDLCHKCAREFRYYRR